MTVAQLAIASGSAADAETIKNLQATLQFVEADRDFYRKSLEATERNHRADVERIGNRLLEEAQDRGWCDQYDEIIDELNANLTVELPVRAREYSVTVNVRVEITVDAKSQDDARSAAYDIARDLERDLDRTSNVVSHWEDESDFEVEEE